MDVELSDPHRLRIGDHEIEFPQRVKKFLTLDSRAVVLLKPNDFENGDELVGRNIVAHDEHGEFVWRIEYHGYKVTNRDGVDVPQAFFGL